MNIVNKLAALALVVAPLPVAAQQATTIASGALVKDDKGGEVGTVVRVEGDVYVIKTDRHEVSIPKTSATPHQGVLLFGLTRDQLNAEVDKQNAARDAAMKVGASILGPDGVAAGTIENTDATNITLKLASGKAVLLPRSAVGFGQAGLVAGMTAAQLEAAASASASTQ